MFLIFVPTIQRSPELGFVGLVFILIQNIVDKSIGLLALPLLYFGSHISHRVSGISALGGFQVVPGGTPFVG